MNWNIITKIRSSVDELSRGDDKGRISDYKDRSIKFTRSEQQIKNRLKKKKSRASGACETINKDITSCHRRARRRGERVGWKKKWLKISQIGKKHTNLEIQEAEWIPNRIKSKKSIQRRIKIELKKHKEKLKLFKLKIKQNSPRSFL